MNTCPCCSTQLLRHARHNGVYLFCPHCWQEMPDLNEIVTNRHRRVQTLEQLISISTVSVINKKDTITHPKSVRNHSERMTDSNSLVNVG
jgi:uncharacterized Zn finger protein (UPF0148 family)